MISHMTCPRLSPAVHCMRPLWAHHTHANKVIRADINCNYINPNAKIHCVQPFVSLSQCTLENNVTGQKEIRLFLSILGAECCKSARFVSKLIHPSIPSVPPSVSHQQAHIGGGFASSGMVWAAISLVQTLGWQSRHCSERTLTSVGLIMAVMIQSPIHLWHVMLPSIVKRIVKYPALPTQHAYITLPPDTDLQDPHPSVKHAFLNQFLCWTLQDFWSTPGRHLRRRVIWCVIYLSCKGRGVWM